MKAKVRKNRNGKWEAVISYPSFGFEKVSIYETKAEALAKVEFEKQESQRKLSEIPTISEYFKI